MKRQQILLIRHAESQKNVEGQFDGDPSTDRLTDEGHQLAAAFGAELRKRIGDNPAESFVANSGRGQQTFRAMFGELNSPTELMSELGSMKSGPYSGMNDAELRQNYPDFFQDLQLFRAGLLSGYDVRAPAGSDNWPEFEKRVATAIDQIKSSSASLKIVICHRSAMMALMVHFARRYLGYPSNHFGFVTMAPLACALVTNHEGEDNLIVDSPQAVVHNILVSPLREP